VKKQILLTGASGFIGKDLFNYLRSLNTYEVWISKREKDETPFSGFNLLDINSIKTIRLKDIEVVIHLAGLAHNKSNSEQDTFYANERFTKEFARKALQHGVKKFIFISTIGVHGSFSNHTIDEQSPIICNSSYSSSKLNAENSLKNLFNKSNSNYCILRPSLVYAQNAPGNISKLKKAISLGIPMPFSNIKNSRSLISLRDLSKIIEKVIRDENTNNKTYVVSSPYYVSTFELVKALSSKSITFYFPKKLISTLFRLLKKEAIFEQLFGSYTINSQKLYKDIGWTPGHPFSQEV